MSSVTSSFRWLAGLSSIPNWVHVVVSIVILTMVGLLDIHQVSTASGNWSNLYYLVAIYAGFFLRGRTELVIYSLIVAMTISFPWLFSPSHVGLQKKALGRISGVATGLMMIAFMRGRRGYVDALRTTNLELERLVADRTAEIRVAYESLQAESAARHELAESLRRSQEQYYRLLDQAPIGLYVNCDNHYAYVNDAVSRMMGATSKDQLLGTSVFDRFVEDDLAIVRNRTQLVLERGQTAPRQELTCRRMDGTLFDVETIAIPFEFENRDAIQVVISDISEPKRLKEELKRERDFLRQLIDSQLVFICVLTPDGTIVEVNQLLLTLAGRSRDEVIGKKLTELGWVKPENLSVIQAAIEACAGGDIKRIEITGTFPNSDPREIDAIFSPLKDKSGQVTNIICCGLDITDRKRVEESLQIMRFCVDHAGDSVYWINREGCILYANRAACSLTGYSETEMLEMVISELDVESEYQPDAWDAHFEELKQSGTMTFESRHKTKDGRIFPVEINANYVQVGNLELNFAFARDISNRKEAERSLRLTEFTITRAVDSLFWVSPTGQFLFVNDSAVKKLGYTREELTQMSVWDICPEVAKFDWSEHWAEIKQRGTFTFEGTQTTKDQRILQVEINVNYLFYEGVEYNCAVVRDITDRKRAEEDLNRVWQNAIDPICIAGLDGYLKKINPAWLKSLGWTEDELLGRPWIDFIHPDDHESTLKIMERMTKGESDGDFENRFRCKDGTYRWFLWNGIVDIEAGVAYGFVRDITERKRLENEILQSLKMEAIGQLAGGIAHDFNNLLTIISGYGELLQSELPMNSPHQLSVGTILDASQRAARLTRGLLEFSRQAIVEPKLIVLNEQVERSINILRCLLDHNIAILFDSEPNLPRILAAPDQIERVLMNLVVNARDAMPGGGQLSIQTRKVRIPTDSKSTQLAPGDYVQLTVADTGEGMTEEVKSKVFEPFFTTKGVGKGTGLGMSVVHGIIKQCGGQISFESELHVGTKFTILLPAVLDAPAIEELVADAAPRGIETILLVEDEDEVRRIVRMGLEKEGYHVLEASDGEQAIQRAEGFSGKIDLLLTDVVMPNMGGAELAARVRQQRPGIRVLFMSGYTDDVVLKWGVTNSRESLLQKPFTASGLNGKVRSVLDDPV